LRLLILNQFYAPDVSPTAQLAASLAERRAAAGDAVTVVTTGGGYEGGKTGRTVPDPPGVRVIRLPIAGFARTRTGGRLADYLSFGLLAAGRAVTLARHDVVVAMTTPPFLELAAFAHRAAHPGSRIVLWNMDCYPDAAERLGTLAPGGTASRALRRLKRFTLRHVDRVVALDAPMRDLLVAGYGAPGRELPVQVIPNWERAELFGGPPREPWRGYAESDLHGRFVVLYLGNAGMGHRFDTVLEAARRLLPEGVVFLFIGGGVRWPRLVAARDGGLRNVVLREYVSKEETPAVLAGAGAALIVLDDAALGVMSPSKLHAYLGAGLPVLYVGPRECNVDEALTRFGCGESLRHGDVDGLVAAVRALRDPATRTPIGARARAAFEQAYSDRRVLPLWDDLLDELAQETASS
jgi:glycosyltransferase involved in cell wall biosynthesis